MTARTRFTRWRGASHEQECSGSGLFITASYLMHSCEPSCHVSFVLTKDADHPAGAITVRAMRAIPKDEVRALYTCPYSFRNPSLHYRPPPPIYLRRFIRSRSRSRTWTRTSQRIFDVRDCGARNCSCADAIGATRCVRADGVHLLSGPAVLLICSPS